MVDDITLPFLLDTGTTVSLLNLTTWKGLFYKPLGPASWGENSASVHVPRVTPRYGFNLFDNLGFTLLDTTGSEIHSDLHCSTSKAAKKPPHCLHPLSSPHGRPNSNVMQALCRSPLALCNDISSELQGMRIDGIIEQVKVLHVGYPIW